MLRLINSRAGAHSSNLYETSQSHKTQAMNVQAGIYANTSRLTNFLRRCITCIETNLTIVYRGKGYMYKVLTSRMSGSQVLKSVPNQNKSKAYHFAAEDRSIRNLPLTKLYML
jgi:hypothetical protein